MNEEITDAYATIAPLLVKAAQPGARVFTAGELRERDERIIQRAIAWDRSGDAIDFETDLPNEAQTIAILTEAEAVTTTIKAKEHQRSLTLTPSELRERDERIIDETLMRAHRFEDGEAKPGELLFKYEHIIAAIEADR